MMELTAKNVRAVLMDCLYSPKEVKEIGEDNIKSRAILVQGVTLNLGFNPAKIAKHSLDIRDMLDQLPANFKHEVGGGWSFLNACMRHDETHWGEHRSVDELLCLGLAAKRVKYTLPREMWYLMPGGVPYFEIVQPE